MPAERNGKIHPRIQAAVTELRLTFRQSQIAARLAAGYKKDELVKDLNISVGTLRTHLRNIFASLCIGGRVELVALVLREVLTKIDHANDTAGVVVRSRETDKPPENGDETFL